MVSSINPQLLEISLFLLLVYIFSIAPLFVIVSNRSEGENGEPSSLYLTIAENYLLRLLLLTLFLSLAGLPPFGGFFSKLIAVNFIWNSSSFLISFSVITFLLVSIYFYMINTRFFLIPTESPLFVGSKSGFYRKSPLFLFSWIFFLLSSLFLDDMWVLVTWILI